MATPGEGHAQAVAVATRLDYAGAPGCPTVAGFQTIVTARLGRDAFRADAPDLVIVRIQPAGRALDGHLEWRDANGASIGEQTFPSRTGNCAELARAMGFALALQIQLRAATLGQTSGQTLGQTSRDTSGVTTGQTSGETRSAPTPTPAPSPAPPTEAARAPAEPTIPSPSAHVEATASGVSAPTSPSYGPSVLGGAGALAGFGMSSKAIAVGRLFATVAWTHVAFELAGEVSAPSTTNRADGAGFSQQQILASVATCGVRGPWSLCAVGKVGELRMAGQGVDVAHTPSGPMVQSGLRLAGSYPLGRRAYIVGHAEALARLTRGTVTLDSVALWTPPRFAALLGIDVALRFR